MPESGLQLVRNRFNCRICALLWQGRIADPVEFRNYESPLLPSSATRFKVLSMSLTAFVRSLIELRT